MEVRICKIHDSVEAFFSLSNRCYDNSQSVFPPPSWQSFLGEQVISSQAFSLSVQTIREKMESNSYAIFHIFEWF